MDIDGERLKRNVSLRVRAKERVKEIKGAKEKVRWVNQEELKKWILLKRLWI
jgi:hypothetical protein